MCHLPLDSPVSVYVTLLEKVYRLKCRVEVIMRPAMDRKIFSAFAPAKHHQRANMNESFKKGLRNALTGLYVSDHSH
jgi:transcription initiation factor TFIIH subunit 4